MLASKRFFEIDLDIVDTSRAFEVIISRTPVVFTEDEVGEQRNLGL